MLCSCCSLIPSPGLQDWHAVRDLLVREALRGFAGTVVIKQAVTTFVRTVKRNSHR